MIKYLVCPNFVRSASDGNRHYVGSLHLMELYRVKDEECLTKSMMRDEQAYPAHLIRLRPDPTGKYELPEK